jgi:hypothetical protein
VVRWARRLLHRLIDEPDLGESLLVVAIVLAVAMIFVGHALGRW